MLWNILRNVWRTRKSIQKQWFDPYVIPYIGIVASWTILISIPTSIILFVQLMQGIVAIDDLELGIGLFLWWPSLLIIIDGTGKLLYQKYKPEQQCHHCNKPWVGTGTHVRIEKFENLPSTIWSVTEIRVAYCYVCARSKIISTIVYDKTAKERADDEEAWNKLRSAALDAAYP